MTHNRKQKLSNAPWHFRLDSLYGHTTLRCMPKMIRKSDLPQKTCASCGRPFTWRKKWQKVWEDVRYCSDRCRDQRPPARK